MVKPLGLSAITPQTQHQLWQLKMIFQFCGSTFSKRSAAKTSVFRTFCLLREKTGNRNGKWQP